MKGIFFLGTLVWGDMEKKEQATCICNTGTVRRQKKDKLVYCYNNKNKHMHGGWVWYTREWNAVFFLFGKDVCVYIRRVWRRL